MITKICITDKNLGKQHRENTKVEYALRGMTQPLGVAAYKTKELIENLKSSLPSIDDLEKTLND